ncbi:MAG TPA: type II toxin-antitoxin system PemK/MazF family toxin [Gemmataceae bacterium]|nr:type II toxin-antitoxin system PemK/MazF family toxin [Gemmataceae bacterium]
MRRGEVYLVDWPYSDRTGSKLRPAVVIQADALNQLISDTVLVAITGRSRAAATEVLIDPGVETASGLTRLSYAVCNNFLTIDQGLLHSRRGELSAAAVQEIEAKIKAALELP